VFGGRLVVATFGLVTTTAATTRLDGGFAVFIVASFALFRRLLMPLFHLLQYGHCRVLFESHVPRYIQQIMLDIRV